MSYVDRLNIIKSMIKAKDDDDYPLYVGGCNLGGIQIGAMNFGGINFGGISLFDDKSHTFNRDEICDFISDEVSNLKKGQDMSFEEKQKNLQNVLKTKKKFKSHLDETPKYRFIKRLLIRYDLQHTQLDLERAKLLVDMNCINDNHIALLEQISELLTAQNAGNNKYKRKDINKYINYAIYRIEKMTKTDIDDELIKHSSFQKIKVTDNKVNTGHYGESAKNVIQSWTPSER